MPRNAIESSIERRSNVRGTSDCSLRDYLNPATDERIEIIDHRKYLAQFIHFNSFAIIFLLLSSAILL